ncbi:unnamed protein product [Candidula unifasciata]|uniref:Activation-induced cytidine deaminase AID domain-containing protein n=1 Tax=Candidula unifasciata TaxID=100452 RepID=A0A8S3ZT01_9EUPU|nr:unnamed protein product [Candidula unifasciata]
MENSPNALFPAFNLLWRAALKDYSKEAVKNSRGNSRRAVPKQQPSLQAVQASYPQPQNQIILNNDESNEQNSNDATNNESVVVCTLECDNGAKFVRQIIHEGTQRSEWSCAEDLFVDWLSCELTSQHAQRIDVTIYFCHVPVNTCSHGLCLWLQNLRQEGKEVNVKIKIASMGSLVSRYLEGVSNAADRRHFDYHEVEDTVGALRKLANLHVVVEPLSAGDWTKLMTLLTDRTSLEALDLQQTPSAESFAKILQNTL